jgi:hypothetical protein
MEIEIFKDKSADLVSLDYYKLLNNSDANPEIDEINASLQSHNYWILEPTSIDEIKLKYLLKYFMPVISSSDLFGYLVSYNENIRVFNYESSAVEYVPRNINFKVVGIMGVPSYIFYLHNFINRVVMYAYEDIAYYLNEYIENYPLLKRIFNANETSVLFENKETGIELIETYVNYCRHLLYLWNSRDLVKQKNHIPAQVIPKFEKYDSSVEDKITDLLDLGVKTEILECIFPDMIHKIKEYMSYYGIKHEKTIAVIADIKRMYDLEMKIHEKMYTGFKLKLLKFNRDRISNDLYGKLYVKLKKVEQDNVNDKLRREELKNKLTAEQNKKINLFYNALKYLNVIELKDTVEFVKNYSNIICMHNIKEAELIISGSKKVDKTILDTYGVIADDQNVVCKLCGQILKERTDSSIDFLTLNNLGQYNIAYENNFTGVREVIFGLSNYVLRNFVKFEVQPNVQRISMYISNTISDEISYIENKLKQTQISDDVLKSKVDVYATVYVMAAIINIMLKNNEKIWFIQIPHKVVKGGFKKENVGDKLVQSVFMDGLNLIILMKATVLRQLDIDKVKISDALKAAFSWIKKYEDFNANIVAKNMIVRDVSLNEFYKREVVELSKHVKTEMEKYDYLSMVALLDYETLVKKNDYSLESFVEKHSELYRIQKKLDIGRMISLSYPRNLLACLPLLYLASSLDYLYKIDINLTQLICSIDGLKHKWTIGIFSDSKVNLSKKGGRKYGGGLLEVQLGRGEILNNVVFVDFKCEKCKYSFIELAEGNKGLIGKIESHDKIIRFYEFYTYRCPLGNSHIYNGGVCNKCGIGLDIINSKDKAYFDKYYTTYISDVKKRIVVDLDDDHKIRSKYQSEISNFEKKISSKFGVWEIVNNDVLELCKLIKIDYKVMANLGFSTGRLYDDFIKMDIIKSDDYNEIENRNMILNGYCIFIIQTIHSYNNENILAELKAVLSTNKISFVKLTPEPTYSDYSEWAEYIYRNYRGTAESNNILLNWLCKNLLNIIKHYNGNKHYTVVLDLVKTIMKLVFKKEELYSKFNKFKYLNIENNESVYEGSEDLSASEGTKSSESSIPLSLKSSESSENGFENNYDMDEDGEENLMEKDSD